MKKNCENMEYINKGRVATKMDELSEKFQRGEGGGPFSIQKSMLLILGTLNRAF